MNNSDSELSTSKAIIACVLPFLIVLVFYMTIEPEHAKASFLDMLRHLSLKRATRWVHLTRSRSTFGPFSLPKAVSSYEHYLDASLEVISNMWSSYSKINRVHKQIGYELGYPEKLKRAERVARLNAEVTRGIAQLARSEFSSDQYRASSYMQTDLIRLQDALKHFIRDWSEAGRGERQRIFEPILDVLRDIPVEGRASMKVLVPGSGMGRLAWEISQLGFNTTAIELSYFMTLGMRFLFSPHTTQDINQHKIYPYANWFSHTRYTDDLFRGVPYPDVIPRFSKKMQLIEGDFLEHTGDYDFVITLFFIDTSLNIISTLSHVHKLLKPGGTWINLGPLLWMSGGQTKLELSLDEVLKLAKMVGFVIEGEEASRGNENLEDQKKRRRTVECEYTADPLAMMKWLYQAEFWVATKIDR